MRKWQIVLVVLAGIAGLAASAAMSNPPCWAHHGTCPTTSTTTTTATTQTTTTSTTTTAAVFTTSLTDGMTITPAYTWTFDPGVATSAGQFWADGTKLASISGPGPYTFTITSATLSSGSHVLGHSWDTTSGVHQAPPSGYGVTVSGATTTTTVASSGTVSFNGLAKQMTTFYSNTTTDQAQSPTVWSCLCFNNNSVRLTPDGRYGKAYQAVIGPGDKNPWNTSAPANAASGQVSNVRANDLGKWDYYAFAVKVPAAGWHSPDWSSIVSLGYETLQGDQIALGITNGQWEATQNSGQLTKQPSGWYAGSTAYDTPFMPVAFDAWQEFAFAVKWATDNTGAYIIYTRQAGTAAWAKVWDKENVPTYAYGCTSYGCVDSSLSSVATVLDKTGLYYGYWSSATTSFPDETVYLTGFTRSSDFATAVSTLP